MNILITSVGRRTKLIEYFKKELNGQGNIVAVDASKLAPALYIADKYFIAPQISASNYIDFLLYICKKEKITAIFSLIDPELSILAKNRDKFEELGVIPIVSSYEACELWLDKYEAGRFCIRNNFNYAKTFNSLKSFEKAYQSSEIQFPVFVKPLRGSGSQNIKIAYNLEELKLFFSALPNMIIQELLKGQEIGIDVYVDIITKEMISIFIKEKIAMRAGETEKAKSIKVEKLIIIIKELVLKAGLIGPIDIDVFELNGEYYISEINPRFGGGYVHAYECGENFPYYILNNLKGIHNTIDIGSYEENVFMMKCDNLVMKREREKIYLSPPHIGKKEMKYIQEAFDTNWIAPLGPNVDAFEREVCDYVGINYGLALSSGTAGIHLALKYFKVGFKDLVFCSSLTFVGSCNPIIYLGAIPVFIDSEEDTWNMSPAALEKAFSWAIKENKMPKAVIIVDLYGQSAQYDLLKPICNKYNVPIIEDAAEAFGATFKGKKCGTYGDIGVFSFNGNKMITTSGGGMVITEDKKAIEKISFWATQAREKEIYYEHKEIGYNYRMSNICAGIGRGQLEHIQNNISVRKNIFERYKLGLKEMPLKLMPVSEKGNPNYWLSVIRLNNYTIKPNKIIEALAKINIESRPLWKPMHLQPFYKNYKYFYDKKDLSSELFHSGICLPSGSSLKESDQDEIISVIANQLLKE